MYEQAAELSASERTLFYGFIQPSQAFKYIAHQPIINENANNIFKLSEAKNISFLIDDSRYKSKAEMLQDIAASNYDVVVINPLFHTQTPFSDKEVSSMRYKRNGARRLIIAMQNVSEAFKLHYYWQKDWNKTRPDWMIRKSFSSQDAFITRYWTAEWQKIISDYTKSIVDSGYDGIFFTGIEKGFRMKKHQKNAGAFRRVAEKLRRHPFMQSQRVYLNLSGGFRSARLVIKSELIHRHFIHNFSKICYGILY